MPVKKDEEAKGNESERCIYWSTARGHQIANFRKEIKEGGQIIQSEVPLKFNDHIYIAENPVEAKFIEASQSFENGRVRKVKSLAEAQALTQSVRRMRKVTQISSSYIDDGNKTIYPV